MNLFKAVNKTLLIVCAAAAIIGLLILIWPAAIMHIICFIIGLGLIAIGVLRILTYIKENKAGTTGKIPNLALGIFLIIAGLIMLFESAFLLIIFPYLFCLVIWFAALYLIQRTWEVYKAQMKNWWIIAIIAFVAFLLAILVTIFLNGNMSYLISDYLLDGMLGSVVTSSLWLTGLSLILCAAGVVATDVLVDMFKE